MQLSYLFSYGVWHQLQLLVLPQILTIMLICALKVSVPIWDVFGHFINLVKILLLPLRENTFTII